jgi:Ras family
MASSYADEIGAMYLETSAKDDLNVQDIFVQLSESVTSSIEIVMHTIYIIYSILYIIYF